MSTRIALEQVQIATPCSADWYSMAGDDRVRFCQDCSLHVYNLSGMTRHEAEGLIASTEGRMCVRMYRRADGTVLTRDCPVGLRAIRRKAVRMAVRFGYALAALLGLAAYGRLLPAAPDADPDLDQGDPMSTVVRWADPGGGPPPVAVGGVMVMGDVCFPNPPPPRNSGTKQSATTTE